MDLCNLGFLNMQIENLLFAIEFHSGGSFERNPKLVYLGGRVDTYTRCDPDRLSYFEIQDMVVEYGAPNTSMVYYLISGGNLKQGLRLITRDEEILYMCELHAAWPTDRITLYVEGGVEPLQVVGLDGIVGNEGGVDHANGVGECGFDNDSVVGECGFGNESVVGECGFGDVVDEGDEGDVLKGDELNKLVCYDWMNDGLERANFTDDIFGRNEDDNAVIGKVGGNEGNNSTHEVGGNEGNNASNAQPSMQSEVESN